MDKVQVYLDRLKQVNQRASVALSQRLQNFHFKLDSEMLSFILINGFFLTFFLFIQLFFFLLWNYSTDIGWFSFMSALGLFYVFLKPTDDEKLTVQGAFTNFDRHQQWKPANIFKPTTEQQLIQIIKDANEHDRKIRVYGAGTAWNTIGVAKSDLIVLDKYKSILNIDKEKKTVKVQAGIRLGELSVELWQSGLTIANVGWMDFQTVGGAVQVSTHASSIKLGNFASKVVAMEVISASGEVLNITSQHNNNSQEKDLFDAARNGLGLLGVVSTVTLQCEDAFNLEKSTQPASLEEAVDVSGKTSSNQYYSFFWFPHVNKAYLFIMNKTTKQTPTTTPTADGTKVDKFRKQAMQIATHFGRRIFTKFAIGITAFLEFFTPTFLGFVYSSLQRAQTIQRSYEALFENFAEVFPHWSEVEYFVPVENANSVMKDINSAIKSGGWRINFPVRVSFVASDSSWLSESYDRDSACFSIGMYQKASQWKQFVKKIDNIMKKYEGRPHWAKYHQLGKPEFETLYPRFNDFQELRKRFDPKGIFLNEYLTPLFGQQ